MSLLPIWVARYLLGLFGCCPAGQIVGRLADQGIMAGAGDFYALRTIGAMGCDAAAGVLRLSFVHYTDEGEVGKLINALDASL